MARPRMTRNYKSKVDVSLVISEGQGRGDVITGPLHAPGEHALQALLAQIDRVETYDETVWCEIRVRSLGHKYWALVIWLGEQGEIVAAADGYGSRPDDAAKATADGLKLVSGAMPSMSDWMQGAADEIKAWLAELD